MASGQQGGGWASAPQGGGGWQEAPRAPPQQQQQQQQPGGWGDGYGNAAGVMPQQQQQQQQYGYAPQQQQYQQQYGAAPPPPINTQRPANGDAHASSSGGFGGGGGFGVPLSPRSLATAGLGAYGGKFLNDGASFVSSNYAKYFSTASTRSYFDVTESYVYHKLRLVLCPFLHKGSWARLPESVAGGTAYKPPRNDINAPDLYIPLMSFWTYVLLASIREVFSSDSGSFTPDTLAAHAWWSALLWGGESAFIWVALRSASSASRVVSAPMLDVFSYVGYTFTYSSLLVAMKTLNKTYVTWFSLAWGILCNGVFMAKTLKRIIFSEARQGGYAHGGGASSSHNYILLLIVVMQLPIHVWLSSTK